MRATGCANISQRTILKALVCTALTAVAAAQGTTQTVLPLGLEAQSGNASDNVLQAPSERQQWYRSTHLASVWNAPVMISGVAFRVNEGAPDYSATIPRVEISLTTTDRSAENLAGWEANRGPDNRTVFAADSVVLNSPGGQGPNSFGLSFAFGEPFYYNPSSGNLLLRIVTFGAAQYSGARRIDVQSVGGTLENTPIAIRGFDPEPTLVQTLGIVTQFSWHTVPEPSVAGLLGVISAYFLARPKKSEGQFITRE